jgi:hypothetical protein
MALGKAGAGRAAQSVGTARVPEVDGERAGCRSQIDVEEMIDLGKTN